VEWSGVDVGADDIRLDLIVLDFRRCGGVANRVQQVPKFHRSVAAALQRRGQHNSRGGVRILAAVFADARHVALDIDAFNTVLVSRVREVDASLSIGCILSLSFGCYLATSSP
jgi:hypothetical protein